jgi:hypothetical protein
MPRGRACGFTVKPLPTVRPLSARPQVKWAAWPMKDSACQSILRGVVEEAEQIQIEVEPRHSRAAFYARLAARSVRASGDGSVATIKQFRRRGRWSLIIGTILAAESIRECWETFELFDWIRRQEVLDPGRCSAFHVRALPAGSWGRQEGRR